ncbi:hypothetical protein [Brevibacterium aurantiacum]|uniref:hypothetical protein n=1 Tax=Brevibacterium aurantiacum TaxID=273384 RepID=UPI000DF1CB1F|nr:hypothetical protein [Brevibacterium aurantiacum]RCS87931.1 hypothetical protein CIK63_12175 [Brevibacterium aurantiacum]RCS93486.1 hypothetical protein CIK61_15450 [Brevibacterium aurantiacum]
MKKLTIGLGLIALVAPAMLVSGPASASTSSDASALTEVSITETPESSKLDEIVEGEEADPKDILPKATEDPAEIDQIVNSGKPTEVVRDLETGQVLAAQYAPLALDTQKLQPTSPGCNSNKKDLCMLGKNYYGFTGTGSLSGTWKSISGYSTGNKQGRLKYGSKWHPWSKKNQTSYFPKRGTISGVARK